MSTLPSGHNPPSQPLSAPFPQNLISTHPHPDSSTNTSTDNGIKITDNTAGNKTNNRKNDSIQADRTINESGSSSNLLPTTGSVSHHPIVSIEPPSRSELAASISSPPQLDNTTDNTAEKLDQESDIPSKDTIHPSNTLIQAVKRLPASVPFPMSSSANARSPDPNLANTKNHHHYQQQQQHNHHSYQHQNYKQVNNINNMNNHNRYYSYAPNFPQNQPINQVPYPVPMPYALPLPVPLPRLQDHKYPSSSSSSSSSLGAQHLGNIDSSTSTSASRSSSSANLSNTSSSSTSLNTANKTFIPQQQQQQQQFLFSFILYNLHTESITDSMLMDLLLQFVHRSEILESHILKSEYEFCQANIVSKDYETALKLSSSLNGCLFDGVQLATSGVTYYNNFPPSRNFFPQYDHQQQMPLLQADPLMMNSPSYMPMSITSPQPFAQLQQQSPVSLPPVSNPTAIYFDPRVNNAMKSSSSLLSSSSSSVSMNDQVDNDQQVYETQPSYSFPPQSSSSDLAQLNIANLRIHDSENMNPSSSSNKSNNSNNTTITENIYNSPSENHQLAKPEENAATPKTFQYTHNRVTSMYNPSQQHSYNYARSIGIPYNSNYASYANYTNYPNYPSYPNYFKPNYSNSPNRHMRAMSSNNFNPSILTSQNSINNTNNNSFSSFNYHNSRANSVRNYKNRYQMSELGNNYFSILHPELPETEYGKDTIRPLSNQGSNSTRNFNYNNNNRYRSGHSHSYSYSHSYSQSKTTLPLPKDDLPSSHLDPESLSVETDLEFNVNKHVDSKRLFIGNIPFTSTYESLLQFLNSDHDEFKKFVLEKEQKLTEKEKAKDKEDGDSEGSETSSNETATDAKPLSETLNTETPVSRLLLQRQQDGEFKGYAIVETTSFVASTYLINKYNTFVFEGRQLTVRYDRLPRVIARYHYTQNMNMNMAYGGPQYISSSSPTPTPTATSSSISQTSAQTSAIK